MYIQRAMEQRLEYIRAFSGFHGMWDKIGREKYPLKNF